MIWTTITIEIKIMIFANYFWILCIVVKLNQGRTVFYWEKISINFYLVIGPVTRWRNPYSRQQTFGAIFQNKKDTSFTFLFSSIGFECLLVFITHHPGGKSFTNRTQTHRTNIYILRFDLRFLLLVLLMYRRSTCIVLKKNTIITSHS